MFHSIRKCVATQLHRAGVPSNVYHDICGWERTGVANKHYIDASTVPEKTDALARVSYPAPLK